MTCTLRLTHYLSTFLFFFNDTATTEIYTLSLHDALPISAARRRPGRRRRRLRRPAAAVLGGRAVRRGVAGPVEPAPGARRSEEHTSELQSRQYLVCRLLLEKKKKQIPATYTSSSRFSPSS